ncbi:formylglycine-generating enzyme family protein [Roseiconus nitratireducens]|uniref:Formylglycine-generating enzyme family protein n=1 Tax=Roseiconus nitratireducens TaxID=2605748 RepID=A0A5M6CU98_9BACT|nr:SUMF1/EgtB/PvdO family nonheme iron enzyme [Roseiconus nitratireducens]KAA5538633.1 formylglycine-generating enzyme family protein [Roseiconus nitratireducens]
MTRLIALLAVLIATRSHADDPTETATIELKIGAAQKLVFRRVSPRSHKIDYPDFFVLETEVTNAQFKAYLDATNKIKDDTEILRIITERRKLGVFSTGQIPYSIEDASTIWRDGKFPAGLDDHPVALVTLPDATAFAHWTAKSHPSAGLIRLPTWNEWMIAAYGKTRHYPWGNEWKPDRAHTSHGIEYDFAAQMRNEPDKRPKRTEPVKARPNGRSPEGIFGLIGNVSEYILNDDPTNNAYFNLGSRSMGGGFTDGRVFLDDANDQLAPRTDYWGYSHHATPREDDLGFRLVIDPSNNAGLRKRARLFKQKNRAWMVDNADLDLTPPPKAEQ